MKPIALILLGPPGSGKGTQATAIKDGTPTALQMANLGLRNEDRESSAKRHERHMEHRGPSHGRGRYAELQGTETLLAIDSLEPRRMNGRSCVLLAARFVFTFTVRF